MNPCALGRLLHLEIGVDPLARESYLTRDAGDVHLFSGQIVDPVIAL